jgi:hypothetical protein
MGTCCNLLIAICMVDSVSAARCFMVLNVLLVQIIVPVPECQKCQKAHCHRHRHRPEHIENCDRIVIAEKGGMVDMTFIHAVADIYICARCQSYQQRSSVYTKQQWQQFVYNKIQVMIRLSEGHCQSQPTPEPPNTVIQQQTVSPSPTTISQ